MRKIFLSVCTLSVVIISAQDKSTDTAGIKTKDIEQVLIKPQHKKQYADKAVYTFDQEALKKARYAKDLLKTLPELQLDPVSNTIISTKGGATLFLINGIEATDMQIRSIQPAEVLKVEYYDNPPARWATRADIVVNILTKNPETGLVFGTDLTSALNTGFINGSAYAGYTKGKNDFGLEYSINLRDYHKRNVESIYDYTLNNSHYRSEENRKEHFGYTDQHIALRYTRSLPDHYTFQAKLEAQLLSNFAKGNGYSTFLKDSSPEDHAMFKNTSSGYTAPTIDLYFSKKLNKKNELSVNLVGSHYTTKSSELAREWVIASGNSVYVNDMRLDARQTGIVGELAHVYEFGKGRLSSGYRISNTSISNDLENLAGFSEYSVNYLEQYFYTEYSGKKDKLSYRLGAGLTNIHNKSAENTFDEWTFTPKVILSYQFTNNQTLRFTSSYRPQSPGSSALSSNIVQMAPNIVQRGNPYLKASQRFGNSLIYSYNNKYFDFNTNLFYWYNNRTVNQYYVLDGTFGGYALTYENARNAQQYGIQLSGSYKPFGNSLLVIKASLTPTAETVKTGSGILIRNSYLGNNIVISSEYQSFSIQYMLNIPVYSLDGAFLKTNENQNHVFANYKQKDWTFTAGMYWIGTPSDYKTKSLPESLVNYSRHNQIWDNKSMLVLGISYDFSKGKKNEINRNLNNSTAPAATF
ncbi:outer membrane beta-barrel protein [uncultured Chryseobacterium sp.]|uniref:TonB-dependent receptor plug domain-containing protein n=1 Tax=uncultured Chryseobacterium sp. TaxID=259322 RepID=UPI0025DAC343|nr:outer membrane beta-barrel protein [uncultured Chryseobacterium sp.]